MKSYFNFFIKTLTIITLFCLQLCLIRYQQSPVIHPLLIAYTYVLFTHPSITTLGTLIFFLDALTFIHTNMVGLTLVFLVPLSWFLLKTRKDIYNKAVAPCFLIFAYQLFYEILFLTFLNYPIHPCAMIWTAVINCSLFVALWHCTNQPFHD